MSIVPDTGYSTGADIPDPSLSACARRVLPGGCTRATVHIDPAPPYAVRGSGFMVTDSTGHDVIDLNNNYTSLIHGHSHPDVVRAGQEAMHDLTSIGLPTPGEIRLATTLAARYPKAAQWRFVNSGSEANGLALRIARARTGRNLVLRFAGSYHGSNDQVLDPSLPGVGQGAAADTLALPLEDPDAVRAAFAEHGDRIAAVLLDLMPNRAGMIPRAQTFVDVVTEEVRRHDALLVVDEVMTGRLGTGGFQSHYDIAPDLTTVGKIVGGGMPIGGVGGRPEVMEVTDPRRPGHVSWGGTFNANPVTMATGATALEHYSATEVARLNTLGDHLRTSLTDQGWRVNGSGSLMRLIVDDLPPAWWACYRAGLLLGTNGLICLSTAMDEETVEDILRRLHEALPDGPG